MEVLSPLTKLFAYLTGNAEFECEVSEPWAKVIWLKGDKEVVPSDKYKIESDGRIRRMIIQGIAEDDESEYTCVLRDKRTSADLLLRGDILVS